MLLTSNSEQIEQIVDGYDKDVKRIRSECMKLSWYMRGGLTYDQALTLSLQEREIISDLIKENLETTKKSGLPFF